MTYEQAHKKTIEKIVDAAKSQGISLEPGVVAEIECFHDENCPAPITGACNCKPDIRAINPPPPDMPLSPLSDSEKEVARSAWADMAATNDVTAFNKSSDLIRAHIFEQTRLILERGENPRDCKPFG